MNSDFNLPYTTFNGRGYDLGIKIGQEFRSRIQDAYEKSPFLRRLQQIDLANPDFTDSLISKGKEIYPSYAG